MRARTDCAVLVSRGSIRINRQPTAKPHARLRVGDVLTIPVHGKVRVLRVVDLAGRRGPAAEASRLYFDLGDGDAGGGDAGGGDAGGCDSSRGDDGEAVGEVSAASCIGVDSSAYRAP
ncbi:RNA-binding S4 domain-containing protein [Rhodopila sp.]|uniref:RNA-binding S4 domain-containing protein n=1 Tax=Rhodopila sp. TaxID=2480087 RepID=UPI003D0FBDBE